MGHRGRSRQWAGGPEAPWQHRDRGRGRSRGGFPPWAGGGAGWAGQGGGPPPWMAGMFGFDQPDRRRGPRVGRGDVRLAILDVLATAAREEESVNGYQVIQQIAERSDGAWRPSPGSVYPTIQQLQDEGLVESDDVRGRRTVRLSPDGARYAEEHAKDLGGVWAPFAEPEADEPVRGMRDLKPEIGQVMSAIWQIATTGSDAQRAAAGDILIDARRKLYGVLADGHGHDQDDEEQAGAAEAEA